MGNCNIFKGTDGTKGWCLPAANETIVTCKFGQPLKSPYALPTLEQSLQEKTKGTFELLEIRPYWDGMGIEKISVRVKGKLSEENFGELEKELKQSYECAKAEDYEESSFLEDNEEDLEGFVN